MTLQSQEFRRFEQTSSHAEASPHKQAPVIHATSKAADKLERDKLKFFAKDGVIKEIPAGVSGNPVITPISDKAREQASAKTSRPVRCVDVETGVKTYFKSLAEAGRQGFTESRVRSVVNSAKPYRGKMWSRDDA